jgi:hypothetical protein
LKLLLRTGPVDIDGSDIIKYNLPAWSLIGLLEGRLRKGSRSRIGVVRLTELGNQVLPTYSTNKPLFYDLLHYLLYSPWRRTNGIRWARFWMYASACDALWEMAPGNVDSFKLANKLQADILVAFPGEHPPLPERSARAVFPWLGALMPPFLAKRGNSSQLHSSRRDYCTPQLFHLATDLVYTTERVKYGTSLAIGEQQIEGICKVCLLDPQHFWEMAGLTQSSIRSFEIRKGQWATSIALSDPPTWVNLPDMSRDSESADTDKSHEENAVNDEGEK